MRQMTRRKLLGRTAGILAAGCGVRLTPARAKAIPPIGRTRPSHLKLSIAAYSYRDHLTGKKAPKMTLFDFVDLAADLALDGVEPTSYYFPTDVTADYLNRLKLHAFKLGLDITGTAVGNNFCLPPGPKRDEQIASVKRWIDHAAELDAPVIRIFAGNVARGTSEEQAVAWAIEGINAVLPYAAQKGIVLALENHGGITATPVQMMRLVKAIDSPNFGVNLDTGNFHGADPYAEMAELAPYALNVQVKTEIQRGGRGNVKENADLSRVIGILREARYSGYVVLEYEAAEAPLKAIPGHIKTLRQLMS
jgi:sugar phosphate isomerase/epimerase